MYGTDSGNLLQQAQDAALGFRNPPTYKRSVWRRVPPAAYLAVGTLIAAGIVAATHLWFC